jgi:hypothetical protein
LRAQRSGGSEQDETDRETAHAPHHGGVDPS